MISGRRRALLAIYETYQKIGIPLLSENNNVFGGVAFCDDSGFFLYIPFLSSLLGIGVLAGAGVFIKILATVFFVLSSLGFCLLTRSMFTRLIAIFALVPLWWKLSAMTDVYIAYAFVFSPIIIFIASFRLQNKRLLYVSSFLIGLISCFSSNIRILASLPVLLFFLVMVFFSRKFTIKECFLAIAFLLIGYSIPFAHYEYSLYEKDLYLKEKGIVLNKEIDHSFWHNMYLGFGFIHNKYDITWDDACGGRALDKVGLKPKYGTKAYEKAMKGLIIDLLKKDKHFFFTAIFARLGIIMMFFLLWFGWLGLLCSYWYPKEWYEDLAFLVALGVSALPGVLTIPRFEYLAGFIACTVLYTIYSVLHAINKGYIQNVFRKS